MSRTIVLAPGEFYHIYNRGTERRDIFMDSSDYTRFISQLFLSNSFDSVSTRSAMRKEESTFFEVDRGELLVEIVAYCLMPNHFHLLVRAKEELDTSRFMQKLLTGYTMYFNKKNERTGALFQGKFKATHVDEDRYLKYLVSYIHLNPVKLIDPKWKENGIKNRSQAKQYLEKYRYSSYIDFLGQKRPESSLLSPDALPEYFTDSADFASTVDEWLSFSSLDESP